ncbi:putative mannosyl-oligosaccharide -alpha-mannosidase protein [Eutypa lata UCREL1]|uniref:mannosyl-oligosaccharide 1,2-alpha-mannosidase n=1 Tax=Eutypa lata (strain UCR-EL1) TaxID=1287681 RepID=M7T6A6_EUTLA|nr:putative mannosyl-oligosaccharide -alpha-mannosidase protein [Eutypa lata UCREL1]
MRQQKSRSRRRTSLISRSIVRIFCSAIATSALAWLIYQFLQDNAVGLYHYGARLVDWNDRREQVKNAFTTSWDAYFSAAFGNETYWRKAEKVMEVLDDNAAKDGLLPIFVHPETGKFTTQEIRLGSRGDSYYEYLIKQYVQTSGQEPIYLDMWEESLAGIQRHLITTTKDAGLKFVAELPWGIGGKLSPKMDHLVCFLPGSIALGATGGYTLTEARKGLDWSVEKENQIQLARDLMKTCWGMYAVTKTGLAPEIAWFNTRDSDLRPNPGDRPLASTKNSIAAWKKDYIVKPLDAHNLQRPETIESLFMMWRITEDPLYREWGWKIFKSFEKYTKVNSGKGYTSLNDVNAIPPPMRDNMESFWLAETLKYLYLLFSPSKINGKLVGGGKVKSGRIQAI